MQLTLTNARLKNKAKIESTFEHYDQLQTDYKDNPFARRTLDTMDACAEYILNFICAPSLTFTMDLNDAFTLINTANVMFHSDDFFTYRARYAATSSNCTQYTLYVSAERDDFDMGNTKSHGLLCRRKPDNEMEYYDSKLQLWKEDAERQKLYNLLNGSDAERDFAEMLEAYTGVTLMMSNEKAVNPVIDNSKELIALSEMLCGLASFKTMVVTENGFEYDYDEAFPILVSSDPGRMGAAVYYRDGLYHLCQMVAISQYKDSIILFDIKTPEFKNSFWMDADTAEKADDLYPLLSAMWDRSSRRKQWLTIPLSKRSYINFAYGQTPDYAVHFIGNEGQYTSCSENVDDLNASETRKLKKLKSMLMKNE